MEHRKVQLVGPPVPVRARAGRRGGGGGDYRVFAFAAGHVRPFSLSRCFRLLPAGTASASVWLRTVDRTGRGTRRAPPHNKVEFRWKVSFSDHRDGAFGVRETVPGKVVPSASRRNRDIYR
ncbi:hypothetical protein BN2537_15545 [Streptomyces venezuelae]|nr:hypothetical protein BN2537_15545 [Streptomyces venezuelae]